LCYTTRYPGVTTSFEDRLAVSEEAADLKKYLKCFRTFAQSLWEEQKRDLLQRKKIEIIQPSQQRPLRTEPSYRVLRRQKITSFI
jgi:hypothetical protein